MIGCQSLVVAPPALTQAAPGSCSAGRNRVGLRFPAVIRPVDTITGGARVKGLPVAAGDAPLGTITSLADRVADGGVQSVGVPRSSVDAVYVARLQRRRLEP